MTLNQIRDFNAIVSELRNVPGPFGASATKTANSLMADYARDYGTAFPLANHYKHLGQPVPEGLKA